MMPSASRARRKSSFPSGQTALTPSVSFPNSASIRSMKGWAQVNVNQKVRSMMRKKIGRPMNLLVMTLSI